MNALWIHSLRATAMIMVVILHAAAPLLYQLGKMPLTDWMTGNIYDSLMRACVPLFFMISGHLLLGKDEALSLFLKKRASKILVPLAFWSVLYLLWKLYFEGVKVSLASGLVSALFTPSYFHLWFVYAIAGLYLAIPIIRKFTACASNGQLTYFVGIWFFTCSLLPLIERTLDLSSRYDLQLFGGYLGYMVLGCLLGKLEYRNIHAAISALVILISWFVTAYGTHHLSVAAGAFQSEYYGYFAPAVALAAAAQFILFKQLFGRSSAGDATRLNQAVISLSTLSFGIYLIHALYLSLLNSGRIGFRLSALTGDPLLTIPATTIATLGLSYLTVYAMSKTPLLKRCI
jgi:surface polysaccharide O-acyltransferase-like enzyme